MNSDNDRLASGPSSTQYNRQSTVDSQRIDVAGMGNEPLQQAQTDQSILRQSSHPVALIFHYLFRSLAILFFWLSSLIFPKNGVLQFICHILFCAFDFWTVKNVTGRLLVGLRWWNDIQEDGANVWVFESKTNRNPNLIDSKMFWMALYIFPIHWAVALVLCILKPTSLIQCVAALVLLSANTIGYLKCEKDAKKKMQQWQNTVVSGAVGSFISNRFGSMFGGGS